MTKIRLRLAAERLADPAMRQKMMTNMAQCRDMMSMMSMMMEHMKHEATPGEAKPAPHKH